METKPATDAPKGNGGTAGPTSGIVVGATVSYLAKVKGKKDVVYNGLIVKSIGKVGNAVRVTVVDSAKKEHDLPIEALTFVSAPTEKVKAPRIKKEPVPYDRAIINAKVVEDRNAGKVRLYPDKAKYVVGQSGSPDGRKTIDIGDDVAAMLRDIPLTGLWTEAAKYLPAERIAKMKTDYEGKNNGMIRMNIGNAIRGAINAKAKAEAKAIADAEAAKNAPAKAETIAAPATPAPKKAAAKKAAPQPAAAQ